MSSLINLIDYTDACDFLEVEPHTRTLLLSLDFDEEKTDSPSNEVGPVEEITEDPLEIITRREGMKIHEFIRKLNEEPLTTAKTVQEFESYFFDKGLVLSKEEIKELLWGTSKLKGLLHLCGNTEKYIGSNSCISLFCKFIKYEYNSTEAEKFLDVYSMTDPDIIRQMHLDYYIKEITSLDSVGLLSCYYYLKYNVHEITDPREILQEEECAQEYEKWIQGKLTCGTLH